MITPKEYKQQLANGIVTTEMMRDALFSVNKRAKNYRDAERECRYLYYGKYAESNRQKKEQFYAKKETLLSYLTPVCIHRECKKYERIRVYDYESDYMQRYITYRLLNRVVWENSYYDYMADTVVSFFDYVVDTPMYSYYLFYICGEKSFHTPITDVEKYDLPIIDIDVLETEGEDCHDLLSVPFVDKILTALDDGSACYTETMEPTFVTYPYTRPTFEELYHMDLDSITACISLAEDQIRKRILPRVIEDEVFVDLIMECRSILWLKYPKAKSRKHPFRKPQVKGICKFKIGPVLKEPDMLAFIYDELRDSSNESDVFDRFLGLCTSEKSPIYPKLLRQITHKKAMDIAVQQVKEEIRILFETDYQRKIVIQDGRILFGEEEYSSN